MTLSQLRTAIRGLVFDDELCDGKYFYDGVNRGIERVRMAFPKVKTSRFSLFRLCNLLGDDSYPSYVVNKGTGDVEFVAIDAEGYYFTAEGVGECKLLWRTLEPTLAKIASGNDWEVLDIIPIDSLSCSQKFRGLTKRNGEFVKGEFKLLFSTDYVLNISCVALYDGVKSSRVEDVPDFSPTVTLDLDTFLSSSVKHYGESVVMPTFMYLNSPITVAYEGQKSGLDYTLYGNILSFPSDVIGDIDICYISRFDTVGTASYDSQLIDIPLGLEQSLAYLVAYNLLLDDDESRANYYLNIYKEHENTLLSKKNSGKYYYRNHNGWA